MRRIARHDHQNTTIERFDQGSDKTVQQFRLEELGIVDNNNERKLVARKSGHSATEPFDASEVMGSLPRITMPQGIDAEGHNQGCHRTSATAQQPHSVGRPERTGEQARWRRHAKYVGDIGLCSHVRSIG